LTGRRHHFVHALHQKYGPVVRLTPTQLSFSDLSATSEIYSQTGGYVKTAFYAIVGSFSRPQLFAILDPSEARWRRKLVSGAFSVANLRAFDEVVSKKVDTAVDKMIEQARNDGKVDMYKWWYLMATDVIMIFAFGGNYEMLEKGQVCTSIPHTQ
jgi:cytochrome P450